MVEWRDVVGYEGLYQVSNLGQVRSLPRNGTRKEPHVLQPNISRWGYYKLSLSKEDKLKYVVVHRLVAEAFLPNPDQKPCVNHIDCNKKNNNVSNLEWVTYKENRDHAKMNNLIPDQYGEHHHTTQFSDADIVKIRTLYKEGKTIQELVAMFEYHSYKNMWAICNNKIWKHLS